MVPPMPLSDAWWQQLAPKTLLAAGKLKDKDLRLRLEMFSALNDLFAMRQREVAWGHREVVLSAKK